MKHCHWIFIVLGSIVILLSGNLGLQAAGYPEKEIHIIVPTSPGGSIDRMSRSVERFLPDILGVRVVVENRKGAGGLIATKHYLKQPADGYTISVGVQPATTFMAKMYPQLVSFTSSDVININWIDPSLILVRKDLGWNSLADMVTAIRENPDKYRFGIPNKFSTATFAGKLLFAKLGLKVREIPYTGTGDSQIALRGGHIDILTGGADGVKPITDIAVALGVFWNEPVKAWPTVRPLNETLKPYNVQVPNMASIRYFQILRGVKENYPARFDKLVGAFKQLVTQHEGFIKFCESTNIGHEWHGPEKSWQIIMESDRVFSKVKLPTKKKK